MTTYACTGDAMKWGSVFTINRDFFKEYIHANFKFPRGKTATKRATPEVLFLQTEAIFLLAETYWASHIFNCLFQINKETFHVGVREPYLDLCVWQLNGLWD